jgi:hypothetical protein
MEDDVMASVTIPAKIEIFYRRPDDTIEAGYDHDAEFHMTLPDSFICN